MSAVPRSKVTYQEYLALEEAAETKSEFYAGEIFAMAGGTIEHNVIAVNLIASLKNMLLRTSRPFNSGQRIRVLSRVLATYPDVSVVCGDLQRDPNDSNAITNPRILFEVLSDSTESYDRGRKFEFYREIDALREYVLISQHEPIVECFTRQDDGTWLLSISRGTSSTIRLSSVEQSLSLADLYDGVSFAPESDVARLRR